jgi:hypothetical protein
MELKHVARFGKWSVLYDMFLKTVIISKVNKPCIAYRLPIHSWLRSVIRITHSLLVNTAKEMLIYSSD